MKGVKLPDGKLRSGKNRLADAITDQLQNYYGLAIRKNTYKKQRNEESCVGTILPQKFY